MRSWYRKPYLGLTKSSRASLIVSACVVHMPCGAPGMTFNTAPFTILAESSPESAIGTI